MPPDVRLRLSAEGIQEVVDAFRKVASASGESGRKAAEGFQPLTKALEGARELLGFLGIGFGVAGLLQFIHGAAALGDELSRTTEILGGTSDKTAALALAMKVSNTALDGTARSLGIFAQRTAQFEQGTGKAVGALNALGISAKDFAGLNLTDRLLLVAQRLAPIQAGAEKDALAMDLFGRRALGMIPLLNALGSGLAEFVDQTSRLFTADAIDRARQFEEQLKATGFIVQGLGVQFLAGLAPAIVQTLSEADASVSTLGQAFERVGEVVGIVIKEIALPFKLLFDLVAGTAATMGAFATGAFNIARSLSKGYISDALSDAKFMRDEITQIVSGAYRTMGEQIKETFTAPTLKAATTGGRAAPGGEDLATARASEISRAMQAEIRAQEDARKLEAEIDRAAYDEGRLSLAEYLERRRTALAGALEREFNLIQEARTRLATTKGLPDEQRTAQSAAIDERAQQLITEATRERVKIDHDEFDLRKQMDEQAVAAELDLMSVEDRRHAKELANIDQRRRANEITFVHRGEDPAAAAAHADALAQAASEREAFEHQMKLAETDLQSYQSARAELDAQIKTGQISEYAGQKQLADLDRARLGPLQAEVTLLESMGIALKDPTLLEAARKLGAQIDQTAAKSVQFTNQIRDSARVELGNFLGGGINEVKGLADAFDQLGLSIARAIQQLAGQELAKFLFSFIPGGKASGGLVTPAPIRRASGGFVSGPGGPTSDAVPAMLSSGEFVIRASEVAKPGVLEHLQALNGGAYGGLPTGVSSTRLAGLLERHLGPSAYRIRSMDEIAREGRSAFALGGQVPPVTRFADGGLVTRAAASPNAQGGGLGSLRLDVGLDDGLVARAMSTPAGQKAILRVLHGNRRQVSDLLGRG